MSEHTVQLAPEIEAKRPIFSKAVCLTLCDQLGLEPNEIAEDMQIHDDLGADSLDSIEIIMELEVVCDCEIPTETENRLESDASFTVGELIDLLAYHAHSYHHEAKRSGDWWATAHENTREHSSAVELPKTRTT